MSSPPLEIHGLRDFEMPRLMRLPEGPVAACFSLMKLIPARVIIDHAEANGLLKESGLICESTSGTFGLALAMIAAMRHYELVLVSDPGMDLYTRQRLKQLNCRIEIVEGEAVKAGPQRARLDRLKEILSNRPEGFWPEQYSNQLNPGSYADVAEFLAQRLGKIDVLVGTVGSGGSMCGIARALRHKNPDLKAIGIDTFNSVIFGQPDGMRRLRGLGNSLVPPNVDHCVFDEIHWLSDVMAFASTRELYLRHGLFMGPTSGCAFLVSRWAARRHAGARIVAIMPDEGHRYTATVYNDAWYQQVTKSHKEAPTAAPREVTTPEQAVGTWCRMAWNRRHLHEVCAPPSRSFAS